MAKLNWNEANKFVWSEISIEDFVQSRSSADDLPQIINKIKDNYSEGQFFAVIYNDTPESSLAVIKTSGTENLKELELKLGGKIEREFLKIPFPKNDLHEIGKELEKTIETL
jgi:hypothetical protein